MQECSVYLTENCSVSPRTMHLAYYMYIDYNYSSTSNWITLHTNAPHELSVCWVISFKNRMKISAFYNVYRSNVFFPIRRDKFYLSPCTFWQNEVPIIMHRNIMLWYINNRADIKSVLVYCWFQSLLSKESSKTIALWVKSATCIINTQSLFNLRMIYN